jgi:hypothetical protein
VRVRVRDYQGVCEIAHAHAHGNEDEYVDEYEDEYQDGCLPAAGYGAASTCSCSLS